MRNKVKRDPGDNFRVGTVVRSVQGRDRLRIFLVTEIDLENETSPIVVADGGLHGIGQHKHKNPLHLRRVAEATPAEMADLSDEKLREIVKRYDNFTNK